MNRGCGVYTYDRLFNECANLTTAQWWDSIKLSLMLCGKHEHVDDENEAEENNDDEIIDDDHIDTADEDIENASVDAASEFDVADQHVHNHDCTEKNNESDAGKREDEEYRKFAAVCARKEESFFF